MKFFTRNNNNISLAIFVAIFVSILSISIVPQTASAEVDPNGGTGSATNTTTPAADCNKGFMGFPAWYRGLEDADCNIAAPSSDSDGLSKFIWHIGLNVVEIAIVATAYISGAFTLYGGILFITSRGNPEGAANARKTILNAVIGLIISMVAIIAIDFIIERLI